MNRAACSSKNDGHAAIFYFGNEKKMTEDQQRSEIDIALFSENFWPRVESFQTTF